MVYCSTGKPHDTHLGWQVARRNAGFLTSLAADKGYDWMELREEGVRPLIKHRVFQPIDHAHNARVNGPRYRQRARCETVFSTIKRKLGDTVRARTYSSVCNSFGAASRYEVSSGYLTGFDETSEQLLANATIVR